MATVDDDIRDLAELLAQVAQGVWEHIGTDEAGRIAGKAMGIRDAAARRLEPKRQELSTVSQETIDRRGKAVLDKYMPILAESVRITVQMNEHRLTHEFGANADCRMCQEEKAQDESRRGKA